MTKYTCKNFGSCSIADSGKDFEAGLGGDDRCPECGMTLAQSQADWRAPGHSGGRRRKPVLIGAAVVMLVLVGGGYAWWQGNQVVVLKPDASAASVAVAPPTPPMAVTSVPATEHKVAELKHSEVNVGETSARQTCDEATKAKSLDAAKICRRAAAVTLLNSGAQAAVAGNLEQAEKDYLAAKDKDPDIPELYFNLAVLKARQGKNSESVDNLTLAASKGFRQFELIATEPAFVKMKADPGLKAKLDALQAK